MKKERIFKKVVCLLLMLVLLVVCLSGCGKRETDSKGNNPGSSTESDNKNNDDSHSSAKDPEAEGNEADDVLEELPLPLCEEKQEISVWTTWSNSYIDDMNDIPGVQHMEEVTNVHVNWMSVSLAEVVEKFGLLLASGNLPDLMYTGNIAEYPGGVEKGVSDGIFADCTDLVEKWMPNYRRLREGSETLMRDTSTDSGSLACLYTMNSNDHEAVAERTWNGLAYRADLMESFGYTDTPVTIEDWHEMLSIAKKNGIEAPLVLGPKGTDATGAFMTAFGILPKFYLEGNEVKYGPAEPGYKQWLDLFRQWYAEGLIDPNFTTAADSFLVDSTYSVTGKSVAFHTIQIFTGDGYFQRGVSQDPNIRVVGVPHPVLNEGDTPYLYMGNPCTEAGNMIYVSATCKDPKLVAMWMDYQYTIEGMRTNFYGVEGESYTLDENGEIQLTDLVMKNPDYSPTDALGLYARGNSISRYNWYPTFHTTDMTYAEPALDAWSSCSSDKAISIYASMGEEEGNKYNSLYIDIETLTNEFTVKYILGSASEEEYQNFLASLETNGLAECIGYWQSAVDRYNVRGQ